MRATGRLTRGTGLTLAALCSLLVAGVTGCAAPQYRYVGSDDRDLVFRLPHSWSALDTDAALKATGVDPATRTSWSAFYDAAPKPSVAHIKTVSTEQPFLYAQSIPVPADQRATLTDDQLRELMLPSTPEARAAAVKAKALTMITDEAVSRPKQHGVHLRYSTKVGTATEVYDRIALTDPKRTAVHVLFVHCTEACFGAHPEIDDVVTSLTLKSH